jgi:hypothetical protein
MEKKVRVDRSSAISQEILLFSRELERTLEVVAKKRVRFDNKQGKQSFAKIQKTRLVSYPSPVGTSSSLSSIEITIVHLNQE